MLSFPEHYFENEIRWGFHITAMMKRMWGAQLEIFCTCGKDFFQASRKGHVKNRYRP